MCTSMYTQRIHRKYCNKKCEKKIENLQNIKKRHFNTYNSIFNILWLEIVYSEQTIFHYTRDCVHLPKCMQYYATHNKLPSSITICIICVCLCMYIISISMPGESINTLSKPQNILELYVSMYVVLGSICFRRRFLFFHNFSFFF